jgi:cell wall-associated NlpC family hydrolase
MAFEKIKGRITELTMPPDEDNSILEAVDGDVEIEEAPLEGPLSRPFSRDAEPHRVLKYDRGNPMRGDDVRALQVATRKRLGARDIDRPVKVDGIFGKQTAEAMDTAAWALGARMDTVNSAQASIGLQRMIRYPGTRNASQLAIARQRMEELEKDRKKPKPKPTPTPGPGGKTDANRVEARKIAVNAMFLAKNHAPSVHYTQGGMRWQGIRNGLKSNQGHFPNYADCSSLYTWALWNAFTHFGWGDTVNGVWWSGGYTGTLLSHGTHVSASQLLPGDAVIYGRGWPGSHVSMYVGNGMCISHGSEAGPFYLRYNYRGDIIGYRRYI